MAGSTINENLDAIQEDIGAPALAIRQEMEQFRMLSEMNRKLIEMLTLA